jgi:drug/metabolite transporter (DMT)-like permease
MLILVATAARAWGAEPGYWPWAIASSLLGMAGMVTFYSALSIGPMGIVAPLVSLSVIVPVVVGLLRGEVPRGLQVIGIIAAVAGILLASGPELSGAETAKPLLLAGAATIAFGGMYLTMAEGSAHSPLMTMTAMRLTTLVVFGGIFAVVRNVGGATRRDVVPLAGVGFFDAAANVSFGTATTMGMLATTSVLGSLYPVVTTVLAAIVLKERLKPVQYAGVTVAIAGVVLISSGA